MIDIENSYRNNPFNSGGDGIKKIHETVKYVRILNGNRGNGTAPVITLSFYFAQQNFFIFTKNIRFLNKSSWKKDNGEQKGCR